MSENDSRPPASAAADDGAARYDARRHRRRRLARTIGLIGAASLLTAACGGDDDNDADAESSGDRVAAGTTSGVATAPADTQTTTADASGTSPGTERDGGAQGDGDAECASDGGELTMGVLTEMPGFDPLVSGTVGAQAGHERAAVFDVLMQYDNETGEFVPRMAESLEPNDDSTEWTLTLRDGVTFGNGEPVDTAAVKYTVDRHRGEQSLSLARPLTALIESMEIVDDLTMTFQLTEPWGGFPAMLAGPVGMVVHPGTVEELGAEAFGLDPQGGGAGPFRVARYQAGEEIVLEAKDDYWGGEVCLDQLRFVWIGSAETRVEAFLNDELDVAYFRMPDPWMQVEEQGIAHETSLVNGGDLLAINNAPDRPGHDVRVRKAIAHAIDPTLLDQRITGGIGLGSTALAADTSLLHSDAIQGLPHDPEQARALLDEAMAETGYDGSITYTCSNSRPQHIERAIATKAMLDAVGFTVTLDNKQPTGESVAQISKGDFDLGCYALGMTDAQPWVSMLSTLGHDNLIGYDDPAMGEAFTALRTAATTDETRDALASVQSVWNETIPSVITSHLEEGAAWHDRVEGLDVTMNAIVLFDEASIAD